MNIRDHNEPQHRTPEDNQPPRIVGRNSSGRRRRSPRRCHRPRLRDNSLRIFAPPKAASLTKLSYQLGWIPNAEFAGTWIALDKGYYKKAGLDVTVIPGGPTTAPIAVVESGTALVTIADPIVTATAVKQGADLKIIGTQYQRSPYALPPLPRTRSTPRTT